MVGRDPSGSPRRVVYRAHTRIGSLDVGLVVSPGLDDGLPPVTGQGVVWSFVGAAVVPLALGAVWMIGTRLLREVTR